MSFIPRTYEEIARDLLTTLTGGTVREILTVSFDGEGNIKLDKLKNRPVRRVSFVEEIREITVGAEKRQKRIRYTSADFELVSSNEEGVKDSIRFRDARNRPAIGATLVVNYYPVQTDPVPVNDLNVGSVIRTLMETFSRELALTELNLEFVYKSAFLETAEGSSLDRVVALVGVKRLPAGHPVVKVQFKRRPETPGRITVPVSTALTDSAGNRYLTLSTLVLEPNETTREVLAGGEGPGTKTVAVGELNRLELLIAGISEVSNPQPARQLSAPETDDELRQRARGAMHGVIRATLNALHFGLLSIPGVKNVTITEFPNEVAGELRVEVAYNEDTPEVRAQVNQKIRELKPAGIRVIQSDAGKRTLKVQVELTLAGTGLPESEIVPLKKQIEDKISKHLTDIPPGGTVRRAQLSTLVLEDKRLVDVRVLLIPAGQSAVENLTLNSGEVIEVLKPFEFPLIAPEQLPGPVARKAKVGAFLPLHLVVGITEADVETALNLALTSFLSTRRIDAPLTVDAMVAATRDDTRYALIRDEALLTVEVGDTFLQLSDGLGEYRLVENETLEKDQVNIEVREGGV